MSTAMILAEFGWMYYTTLIAGLVVLIVVWRVLKARGAG